MQAHRLDDAFSGGRATTSSLRAPLDAAGQRDVRRHEAAEIVGVARGRGGPPEAQQRPTDAVEGPSAAGARVFRGPAGEIDRDEGRTGRQLGLIPAPGAGRGPPAGRGSGPAGRPARGGPARPVDGDSDRARRPRRGGAELAMPTIGMPRPWARPLAVARPTRRPVNVPGPVPTTIARRRDRRTLFSPSIRPSVGRSVSPWRWPATQVVSPIGVPSGRPRAMTTRDVPCRGRGSPATPVELAGLDRRSSEGLEIATVAIVGGLEPHRPRVVARAGDPDVESRRGQPGAEPLGPLDERDAVGLALVEEPVRDRRRPRRPAGTGRRGTGAAGRRTRP